MSIRKSTCLTPQRLDAARRNSQCSTGPRSEAGKERMKMNAVKHGCDAALENEAAVMRALGEDPERFADLQRELATAYGPGDAFWDHQIADLGKLYWRRNRIERMVTGMMRDALAEVEERRRALARALADVTFEPSQCEAVTLDLPQPTHPRVRLRMLISLWGVVREQVRRRVFTLEQRRRIDSYYKEALGWRPRQICHLMLLFINLACYQQERGQTGLSQYVKEAFGSEAGIEARFQELERLVEEQIAEEQAAFEEEMAAQEERDAAERDACLAPAGKTWEMLLRQEMALDRSIDRKVRIILTLRQEHARLCRGGSRTARTGTPWRAPTQEASPPGNEPHDRAAEELSKVVGLDARTESPAEENAALTPKSPEQSQNVIENKAPAVEEVRE